MLYDTESATYRDPEGRIGLSGNHTIATIHGELHCRTAFQRYSETCREYSGPEIETVTGVSPTQLYETAKLIHQYGPLSYYTWTGTAQNTQATQTGRAMALLYALTGALDAAGGNTQFERPQLNNVFGHELLSETQRGKTLGLDERPLGPGTMGWISSRDLYSAISDGSPYPVKALISFGANPLLTKPAPHAADAALRKLDFHVHCDLFMNPSAANADIVLPVCSAWEREGLNAGFQISQQAEAYIQLRPAVVEPRGDSRSDEWIVFELAKHLGLGEQFFNGDHEAALRHQLEPSGVTLEALREAPRGIPLPLRTHYRKYRHQGFNTPSRRIELYSQVFLDSGYPPLPEFIVEPAKNSYYPLLLTSAKTVQYCHSQQRNLPLLRKSMPRPLIDIHPNTANVFGIAEHDEVVVTTDEGVMNAEARFNSSLAPDVLCSQYGWWQACNQLGIKGYAIEGRENGNYNNLISDKRIDPISSSNTLRHSYCKIKRRAEATTPQ
ncbi:molybdopterin-containing oxidoreductase family protein [Candidatus Reidiella endopervernicosa]|uniref:Molybdopterin-dependent oxidoreductase n=1 Tax=Candidatus Reidiella endopervernicosa TaxID=2738883 RepID=A0A6N0HWC8_9GAMM|nr:molybdopterin-dependent oxidoreductase [Candidatus Reidiella endopervernicosa]QKQ26551.1 molybdopterin-dependent oxidoreductase [Candidatus Reidiella endopervernicosa]